jgi:carbohydrate kinase (thermoresistant glucokinase family)
MVILVMGVSGAGKSTVGRVVAERTGARFHDADDDHPPANVAKMERGVPLTDDDRAAWVRVLRTRIDAWLRDDATVVLACSALTGAVREGLGTDREGVRVVYLRGSADVIRARMDARDHFMPPALLDSQLATLEPPSDALELDVSRSPDELAAAVVDALGLG